MPLSPTAGLFLGHDKDKVTGAPRIADDGHLSVEDEAGLYDYYEVAYVTGDAESYHRDAVAYHRDAVRHRR